MDRSAGEFFDLAADWFKVNVFTANTAAQWVCIAGALSLAFLVVRFWRPKYVNWVEKNVSNDVLRSALATPTGIGRSLVFFLAAQICISVFIARDHFPHWLFAASDLAVAWIFIRVLTFIIPNKAIARFVAFCIWAITFLQIVNVLPVITYYLQGLAISVGDARISVYGAVKGVLMALLCLQVASLVTRFSVRRIEASGDLSPTLQVLATKLINIFFYTAAILLAMSSVGIDLTSLTIFSSAVGVGIGFGLKTIFSNYVSGILLLLDNSIRPGDTIEIEGVLGTVRKMHGRYASLKTRDGREFLVPNEEMIASRVVNWTHSDRVVRLAIPVSIAYKTSTKEAARILEMAPEGVERVLEDPRPVARLVELGESSINMELWIWIADADAGIKNVKSDVLFRICDLFEEHGIEFPFPQRDVHIKPESVLQVEAAGTLADKEE